MSFDNNQYFVLVQIKNITMADETPSRIDTLGALKLFKPVSKRERMINAHFFELASSMIRTGFEIESLQPSETIFADKVEGTSSFKIIIESEGLKATFGKEFKHLEDNEASHQAHLLAIPTPSSKKKKRRSKSLDHNMNVNSKYNSATIPSPELTSTPISEQSSSEKKQLKLSSNLKAIKKLVQESCEMLDNSNDTYTKERSHKRISDIKKYYSPDPKGNLLTGDMVHIKRGTDSKEYCSNMPLPSNYQRRATLCKPPDLVPIAKSTTNLTPKQYTPRPKIPIRPRYLPTDKPNVTSRVGQSSQHKRSPKTTSKLVRPPVWPRKL